MPDRTRIEKVAKGSEPSSPEAAPRPEAAEPKKHFEIDIYRAWCKACGICAAFCPRKCLSLDEEGNPVVADAESCTGCGWCELHCPDFAISVRECLAEKPKEEAD
ncbi:MAG: 4Fe-4S binding protein [Deltaproteobacteria bacterium]|nr:4Fe-4S binding protein [Deltaproteobacteria bacterium]